MGQDQTPFHLPANPKFEGWQRFFCFSSAGIFLTTQLIQKLSRLFVVAAAGIVTLATPCVRAQTSIMEPSIVAGTYRGSFSLALLVAPAPVQATADGELVVGADGKISLILNTCTVTGELTSGRFFSADNYDYSGTARISGCQDSRFNVASAPLSMNGLDRSTRAALVRIYGSGTVGTVVLEAGNLVRLTPSAGQLVNGGCGSANGGAFYSPPIINLCSSGVASLPGGSGPWTWTCSGANGGSNASCQANVQSGPPPTNDRFANLIRLVGNNASASIDTAGAALEAGEPQHVGKPGGASVWYAWTAPASGSVVIDTVGSGFDTLLAVYTGSAINVLIPVAENDDVPGTTSGPSRVAFDAIAGTDYKIAIDGFRAFSGTANIRISYSSSATPVVGVCGFAHNQVYSAMPTTGLCTGGVASGVSGTGPWTWSCAGSNGGSSASCSAARSAANTYPTCTVTPQNATVLPGQRVVITAQCTNSPTRYTWVKNAVTYQDGPSNVVEWTAGAAGEFALFVMQARNAAGASIESISSITVSQASAAGNFQGAWWAGQSENGWGLSFIQHGQTLVVGWYYYDAQGQPVWAVVPGCTWNFSFTTCSGPVMASTSAWHGAYSAAQFAQTQVGTASFAFSDAERGTMTWAFDGTSGTRAISRLQFQSGSSPSGIDYSDIWWGGQAENGWGISIVQQGAVLSGIWYTYNQQGRPVWYLINGGSWTSPTTYSAPLTRSTGSALIGANYNAALFDPRQVGSISMAFTSATEGTVTYTVDGVTRTKAISRLAF
jgi:hypothetical protein